ncbi:MAG: ABC transporter permease [Planctomycetota bacterium]
MKNRRIARHILLGVKNLTLHKLRSLLTMLGVVFGVGSVIAMLAVGEGASQAAIEQIRKLGSHNIILTAMKPVEEAGSTNVRRRLSIYGLLYEDEERLRATFPQIRRTVPAKIIRVEGRLGSRLLELRVVGTTPDWFELVQRPLVGGRRLLERDMAQRANAVVLTEYGARRLLATEKTIGQSVRIGGQYFEVVGIIQSESGQSGDLATPDMEVDAYIPLTVARERFGDVITQNQSGTFSREQVELHQLIIEVESIGVVEAVAEGVLAMLERFHKNVDYRMSVPLALLRQTEATQRVFSIVLGSIAGISLLVGGIGIMNIMLASVTERTREIGIRRAIGARRSQIVGQFLIETVVLSTVGGLIGIGIGVVIPWLITYFAGMPTRVPLYAVGLSVGISMGVGILFGLYPATRAARLDPIVALRHQ